MITFPGSSPRQYLRVRLSTYSSGAVVPGQDGKNPVAALDRQLPRTIRSDGGKVAQVACDIEQAEVAEAALVSH